MHSLFIFMLLAAITTASLTAQPFTFTKVADTATAIPNGTGNFANFSNMISVDASGAVAFGENNSTTNNGIYLSSSGVLSRVADLHTAIPGGTGNFTGFALFGNGMEGGRLAFRGNGSSSQAGVYAYTSGNLTKIVDASTAIPGGSGNFTSFGTGYVDGTNYAFIGPGNSSQQGLYVSDGSTVARIADKASAVPGIGGVYGWSSQVGFDTGNLAFWANITGGTSPGNIVGGYSSGGGLVTLASMATTVPGAGTNFTSFTSPVDLSGATVAFRGIYTGGQGIYTANLAGGAITTIADLSTAVPDGTVNFTQVQNPTISSGGVVFQGSFAGGSGIYLYQDSVLKEVIATTDLLDGKTISSFGISENSLADGYLAFRANFADSSVGIYRTLVAPTVVVRKPDVRIRTGTSGAFLGDGVYNTTGASQSQTKSVKPGETITFGLSIENDGTAAEIFKVKATGGAAGQYTIKYYRGNTDITAKISAGTYVTTSLAPGGSTLITAKVKVKLTAAAGSSVTRLVTIASTSSASKKDAVKFTVKRSK